MAAGALATASAAKAPPGVPVAMPPPPLLAIDSVSTIGAGAGGVVVSATLDTFGTVADSTSAGAPGANDDDVDVNSGGDCGTCCCAGPGDVDVASVRAVGCTCDRGDTDCCSGKGLTGAGESNVISGIVSMAKPAPM